MFHSDNKNCPIFVNFHKKEDISETTKYEDKFTDASTLEYMSKSNRKLSSPDVIKFSEAKEKETRIPLFVKKKNIEGDDFYYMGDLVSDPKKFIQTTIKDKKTKTKSML